MLRGGLSSACYKNSVRSCKDGFRGLYLGHLDTTLKYWLFTLYIKAGLESPALLVILIVIIQQ